MQRWLFFLLVLPQLAWSQAPASADDARAMRAIVEAQIEAFRRDDGARAFSYASSGLRTRFGSPEVFMEMVRTQYAPVYRPRSLQFDAPLEQMGQLMQPVRLTDADGAAWRALYPMVKEDGAWRIDGCFLARVPGQQI